MQHHIILCCTICACRRGKALTGGCRYPPITTQRLHFSILQCCNEVNASALGYDTGDLRPLPRAPADGVPAARKWFHLTIALRGRSMRLSVTNHLHGMWCEWDLICSRGGAACLFPGWAALFWAVLTGDATSRRLHCPGLSATVRFIPCNTILHTFFFHSCWHFFFFF